MKSFHFKMTLLDTGEIREVVVRALNVGNAIHKLFARVSWRQTDAECVMIEVVRVQD